MAGNIMSAVASLWGTQAPFLSLRSEDSLSKDWPSVLSYSFLFLLLFLRGCYKTTSRNRGSGCYRVSRLLHALGVACYKKLQTVTRGGIYG